MLQKNQIIELKITDITHEGSGVARFGGEQGTVVFVPGTAVGDVIRAHVLKVTKTCAFAKAEQIITPSPDRIAPDCPVYGRCGGCSYRHMTYEAELALKLRQTQSNLNRIGGAKLRDTGLPDLEGIIPSPRERGYRNKLLMPVRRDAEGKLQMGFFALRSHRCLDCRECALQPEIFTPVLNAIAKFIDHYEISVYDEESHRGLVRHVYLRLAEQTGQLMVCLVINGASLPHAESFVEAVCAVKLADVTVKTVVLNHNTKNTNVILGPQTTCLYGDGWIEDEMCGVKLRLSPLSFYQVNLRAAEKLYETAAEFAEVKSDDVLLDLYCGAGSIGLSMAHRVKELIGVEIIPQAVENARENAAASGVKNARFLCADAAEAAVQLAEEGLKPDVIVVDPPRAGCEVSVLDAIDKMSPERLVMISCNSATLARDLALLAERGYIVQRGLCVDLFPRTTHVETVVLLSRGKADDYVRISVHTKDLKTSMN